jgi:ADP-ribose/FAD diphosphatase
MHSPVRFCPSCGASTRREVPQGEDRERDVCSACGAIHYLNPKMVVGCLIEHEGRILMCKRAIEPRRGYWTVPAGFLELGEGAMAGAERETLEEACARVRVTAPYAQFCIPHIGQIYMMYRARFVEPSFAAGAESLEVRLVPPGEIPWSEIAFPVIRYALELMIDDLATGAFRTHQGVLVREPSGYALRDHIALPLTDRS